MFCIILLLKEMKTYHSCLCQDYIRCWYRQYRILDNGDKDVQTRDERWPRTQW